MLKSEGAYKALCRGEVPFFKRDLANKKVHDEDGNEISSAGCTKVGEAIATEMNGRRDELKNDGDNAAVYAQFTAQMVPQIGAVNATVLEWLQGMQNRNQNH